MSKPTKPAPDGDDYLMPGREGGKPSAAPPAKTHREPHSAPVKVK